MHVQIEPSIFLSAQEAYQAPRCTAFSAYAGPTALLAPEIATTNLNLGRGK